MNRAGRRIEIRDRNIGVRAHWQPSGAHRCEISLGGPNDILLTVGEVERLYAGLAAFRSELISEDGRTCDRLHPACKPIGEF